MATTFPAAFDWVPSHSSKGSREPGVMSVVFEDYEQEAPNGVNNNPLSYDLVFTNIPREDLYDIDAYLSAAGGYQAFDWTPPAPHDGAPIRVKCKKWDWVYDQGLIVGLTATFVQKWGA